MNTNFGLERIASKIVSLCSKKVTTRLGHFQMICECFAAKARFHTSGSQVTADRSSGAILLQPLLLRPIFHAILV